MRCSVMCAPRFPDMTNRNQITVDYDEGAVQSSVTLQAQSKAGRAFHGIDQAPVTADRPFQLALPGLVVGLDQIDAETFAFCQIQDFGNDTGLIGPRGQRARQPTPVPPAGLRDPGGEGGERLLTGTGFGFRSGLGTRVSCALYATPLLALTA